MMLEVDIKKKLGTFQLSSSFCTSDGITAILGASGCGKSLTLKCISGIERPDSGRIVLDGRVLFDSEKHIDLPPQERRVGYLFQSYALFPTMSVRKNILTGLKSVRDKAEKEKRYEEVLELLQLNGLEALKPWQLSGGQQQRVALARMLVSSPDLLLFDEPFSALDTSLREALQPQLKHLINSVGRQAVLVTHSQSEAQRLSGHLCLMENGRIIKEGATSKVFASPGSVSGARLTGYRNIARSERIDEHHIRIAEWGLELESERSVPESLKSIAFKSNALKLGGSYSLEITDRLDEGASSIIICRYPSMPSSADSLWWYCPSDAALDGRVLFAEPDVSEAAFLTD